MKSIGRVDAVDKVTGSAEFTVDFTFPGSLHGSVVRSDRAHAKIVRIDVDLAKDVPGCVEVVTAADLTGLFARFGHITANHSIMASDKVRYFGEPVAIVLATSPEVAAQARRLVRVEYIDLPAVLNHGAALDADAPLVHDDTYETDSIAPLGGGASTSLLSTNVAHELILEWGNASEALASADVIVESRASYPMLYAYAMEPYNASARFMDGKLEVVSATQHPFMVVRDLARVFGMPHSKVNVRVPYIGGSYGSKSYTKIEPLVAAAAWHAGCPVKLALDVEESIYTGRSLGAEVTVRSGLTSSGQIVAREFDVTMDVGAYLDNSPLELEKTVNRCFGPYAVPNLRVRGRAVYTNTVPAASYRGFGAFQGNLAGETNIDMAAQRLGLTPFQIRERNLVKRGATLVPGMRAMDSDLTANLALLEESLSVPVAGPRPGWLRGSGIGVSASDAGALPTSTALVRVQVDGSVVVATGSTEMGQGSRTVLATIAMRELGVDVEKVEVLQSDTATTPFERTTGASRTTVLTGLAVQRACHDALGRFREIAAKMWEVPLDETYIVGGGVGHRELGTADFAGLVQFWFGPGGGEISGLGEVRREGTTEELPPFWEIGMVGIVLDIEVETGRVEIPRLVTVSDVGCAINPVMLKGQDAGAVLQGLGAALSEELLYDGVQIRNPNMVEYRVPHIVDRPQNLVHVVVERGDGVGPYGSKGAGEGARNPIGGAVASAVADATGKWPERLPLTPEVLWELAASPEV